MPFSYCVDAAELFRRGASYIDRIPKGAKPTDLPVQQPSKFELVTNLKTAKALGFDVPPKLLARLLSGVDRTPFKRANFRF